MPPPTLIFEKNGYPLAMGSSYFFKCSKNLVRVTVAVNVSKNLQVQVHKIVRPLSHTYSSSAEFAVFKIGEEVRADVCGA